MNLGVDQSTIPPLVVFEEPLASFTSSYPATPQSPPPSAESSRASHAQPAPLVVTALCFDEVASDIVLLTNENTICFFHVGLSRPKAASSPRFGSGDTQRMNSMTDLALSLTVQRRIARVRRAPSAPPPTAAGASDHGDARATPLVTVRAARRCPTMFYASTTGANHAPSSSAAAAGELSLEDAEKTGQILAYQIVAVSCEETAVYLYRCFNAQSELTEAALATITGRSTAPLAAFAVYQSVPNNLRFSDPCYPIRNFYWVVPSEDATTTTTNSGTTTMTMAAASSSSSASPSSSSCGALSVAAACTKPSPRLLCVTSVGVELVRLGTAAELDPAAHHQSTHGAEGLPTVLTLLASSASSTSSSSSSSSHDASAPPSAFTRQLLSGCAVQERYPTRVQHWHYHPSTRLLLVLRDDERGIDALQKAQQTRDRGVAMDVPISVIVKPFEVSPERLRPMCRLELPLHDCDDLVRALHAESAQVRSSLLWSTPNTNNNNNGGGAGGIGTAEDPRMLASRALEAHLGVVLLYGNVFIYHVVARDAVVVLYQYHPAAAAQGTTASTHARPASTTTATAPAFLVTRTNTRPQLTSASSTSAVASLAQESGDTAAAEAGLGEYYQRRVALDLSGFASFRAYRARHASGTQPSPSTASPPSVVVQVCDNMLVLHVPGEALSAVFDVAALSTCVEAEELVVGAPETEEEASTEPHPAGPAPVVLRLNAIMGRHARPVSLPCSLPPPVFNSSSSSSYMDSGEDWLSVPASSMNSRVSSVAQSLYNPTGRDGVSISPWASSSDLVGRDATSWQTTRSAPTAFAGSASPPPPFSSSPSLAGGAAPHAPKSRRVPIGLYLYTTTRAALLPNVARTGGSAGAVRGVALQKGTTPGSASSSTSSFGASQSSDGRRGLPRAASSSGRSSTGGGLNWLLGKLPTSLTGLDKAGGAASGTSSMFGAATPLCRAELQESAPVPLLPPLLTAPLTPYAATHAMTSDDAVRPTEPRRWYTACRFACDAGTLPLLFEAHCRSELGTTTTTTATPGGADFPLPGMRVVFNVHLVHVNPFAVAAAASARFSGPYLALSQSRDGRAARLGEDEFDDVEDRGGRASQRSAAAPTPTHSLSGRDATWRITFYLRRLFCGGEVVPRLLRTMLRCSESVADGSTAVYSPEACSPESIGAALTSVVAQHVSARTARQAYADRLSRSATTHPTASSSSPGVASAAPSTASATACVSEWEVYPGPVLGMSPSAFVRSLRAIAESQATATVASPPSPTSPTTAPTCKVFTNHPQRVQETTAYLAHFTAPPAPWYGESPTVPPPLSTQSTPTSTSFLSLLDVLTTCLLPSGRIVINTTTNGSKAPLSSLPSASGEVVESGTPLRVYRSFQQRLLVELVWRPAVRYAQAWAEQEQEAKSPTAQHPAGPGLPIRRDPASPTPSSPKAPSAGITTSVSPACRERFGMLLSALLFYSSALRDVGEAQCEDVQQLIVTVLLVRFPGSLKSLARAVNKCLRRGVVTDQLSTALRLLQHRDALIAAQAWHGHSGPGSPLASPLRLLSSGGFDPQEIQDPLSGVVMGMLARCGGAYERITIWLRRRDPLHAARDLGRYAATVPCRTSAAAYTSAIAGAAASPSASSSSSSPPPQASALAPMLSLMVTSAEEDWNLLLASQDVLQCAANSVDEAEMGLMGPRRWSGGVINTSITSPLRHHHNNSVGSGGGGGAAGSGGCTADGWPAHNSSSTSGSQKAYSTLVSAAPAVAVTRHSRALAAAEEHASRKSRQLELQARRKEFVLVFQLLSVLVRNRIEACYVRRVVLESYLGPTVSLEDGPELNAVLTSIQVAEKMEAKMLEYERRFIAVLHS